MSIETTKLMNLADGKVLYDDLRGRVENRSYSWSIAAEYNDELIYQENDLCMYEGSLYKHKSWGQDTPAAEDWDNTHWETTNAATEFGGGPSSSAMIHYGYCETAAATDTKTCSISTVDSLFEGLMVRIRFKYEHTGTGVLQLNVSNTGNKSVVYSGTDYASVGAWAPGSVLDFLYDGTNWVIVDGNTASTSRYGRTKLVNNLTTTSDSTALTATQGKVLNDSKLNIDQGSANAGKLLGIGNDGNVSPVTVASFGGATSSTAGTSGYVPAPSAGDQLKYLCADGSWEVPPGAKPVPVALDTVTNSSGSYTHTTACEYATAGMKPILIELSDPNAFCADITVTVTDGYITLSCDKVIGTSDVTVSIMKTLNPSESDPPAVTSSEFDILANRIGTLSNLTTTAKTNIVSAVNELDSDLGDLSDEVGGVEESIAIVINGDTAPSAITSGQYLFIKNHSTLATGAYHATDAISSGDTISSSNVAADAEGIANALNANLSNKLDASKLRYEDKPLTTGTSKSGNFYYADYEGAKSDKAKVFGAFVISSGSNHPAFAMVTSNGTVRVFAEDSGSAVTVRIVFKDS